MASLMNSDDWTLVAVLGVPHCLYAFIWFLPTTFIACCCGAEPVGTFYKLAATLKVVQFAAYYRWLTLSGPLALSSATPAQWAAFAVLMGCGQALNAGIYRAIGKKGVYYGFKLGYKVPWASGFPFNLGVRHPQYVGATLTVWALAALLYSPSTRPSLVPVSVCWSLLYVITAIIEDYF